VEFKKALCNALSLYYPEYDWTWILRVDASDIACGAILLQVRPSDGALLPINITSKKFSSTAQGWSTIEKEGFGCYHGIKSNDYLLRGKEFILETDHNNLVWIKTSEVPKIIRWRVYMQSFNFLIRHIRGTLNTIADYLSRMHTNPSTHTLNAIAEGGEEEDGHMSTTYVDLLRKVHGGRNGHWGVRQTWLDLNKLYPGHRIPYRLINDFVNSCPICQKDRLRQLDNIQPVTRHLHQDRPHRTVGIDHLTITPEDKNGNKVAIVIVDLFDKFADPSPHKDYTAETAATALFKHICDYGMVDTVVSDPGSAFTSEVVEQVLKWLGPKHVISLVDVHTSNGVEPANREILRHLKALIYDERILNRWSDDTVFPIIKFLLNSHVSSETGMEPFRLRFGDRDKIFMQLPETNSLPESACEFVRQLNENLSTLRETSQQYQKEVLDEKLKHEPPEEQQNQYQPGDYVLYHRGSAMHNNKLLPTFKGPYKVITHYRNDVTCRNLITDAIEPAFQASRLKMWHGTAEEAFKAAMLDNDQFVVDSIIAYRGDPDQRTSMEFEVRFSDGTIVWKPWDKDLDTTQAYEEFVRARPALSPLLYTKEVADRHRVELNRQPITEISPGESAYVDIRCYSAQWYIGLGLPDPEHNTYVVKYQYTNWGGKKHNDRKKLVAICDLFDERHTVTHEFIQRYGQCRQLLPHMTLVDKALVLAYPLLLQEDRRERLLQQYRNDLGLVEDI
jgi:hypothetical protein